MAVILLLVLMVAKFGGSDATWCVCRTDVGSPSLQKTLDYACGAGADCTPIQQNGACYQPNTIPAHCSYAANSYYQRKGQAPGACDFSGTATLTSTDPSVNGCTFPATPSAAGTSSTTPTGGGTSGTTPPAGSGATPTGSGTSGTTPTSTTPSTFSPTTGGTTGTGGVLGGLGPSGTTTSSSMDGSDGGLALRAEMSYLLTMFLPALALLLNWSEAF